MKAVAGPRWAMTFADLCMLLLGFFVLLHARVDDGERIANGVRTALGGHGPAASSELFDEAAAPLFEPGEAVLLSPARARFAALGRRAAQTHAQVQVESRGTDAGTPRLDRWELTAARTAAVARAVAAGGMAEKNIIVSIPNVIVRDDEAGQRIRVSTNHAKVGTALAK